MLDSKDLEILAEIVRVREYNTTFFTQLQELMSEINQRELWLVDCPERTEALKICDSMDANITYIENKVNDLFFRLNGRAYVYNIRQSLNTK